MTWRIEPQKVGSLLFGFCHCVKFKVRVSVRIRERVKVGFRVRVRVGIRVRCSLVTNID